MVGSLNHRKSKLVSVTSSILTGGFPSTSYRLFSMCLKGMFGLV